MRILERKRKRGAFLQNLKFIWKYTRGYVTV